MQLSSFFWTCTTKMSKLFFSILSANVNGPAKVLLIALILLASTSLTACQGDNAPPAPDNSPPNEAVGEGDSTFVSPVSPIPAPAPAITEATLAEIGFEGCLLFTSNRSGDFEIYKMEQTPSNLQQLTGSAGLDIDPAWSPDGQQIAFASSREGEDFQIYVMNADGSSQQRLGPAQPGDNSHPTWSPDGSQIIFQSKRDTNSNPLDDNFDLYLMNSDGSDINVLTTSNADDSSPSWSPDGSRIAFLSERSGQDEVYVMAPGGTQFQQLTEMAVLKSGLNWSPDGQFIIFEGDGELYIVQPETESVTKLVSLPDSTVTTPALAQNDQLIIFSTDRNDNWDLYALSTGNPDDYLIATITSDPGVDRSPAWFQCN